MMNFAGKIREMEDRIKQLEQENHELRAGKSVSGRDLTSPSKEIDAEPVAA